MTIKAINPVMGQIVAYVTAVTLVWTCPDRASRELPLFCFFVGFLVGFCFIRQALITLVLTLAALFALR